MNIGMQNYGKISMNQELNNFKKKIKMNDSISKKLQPTEQDKIEKDEERLKSLANEFTSIMMKEMFKNMRNTIPEGKLIDGGFAEEVFTDMLDNEYSKSAVKEDGFNSLGRLLYQQLKNRRVR